MRANGVSDEHSSGDSASADNNTEDEINVPDVVGEEEANQTEDNDILMQKGIPVPENPTIQADIHIKQDMLDAEQRKLQQNSELTRRTTSCKERLLAYTISQSSESSEAAVQSNAAAATPAPTNADDTASQQIQATQRRSILVTPGAYSVDPEGAGEPDTSGNENHNQDPEEVVAEGEDPEPSATQDPQGEEPMAIGAVLVEPDMDNSGDVEDQWSRPVASSDEEVVHGTVLHETPDRNKGSKASELIGMAAILVLLVVLVLVPVLVIGGGNKSSSESGAASESNTNGKPIIYPPFQEGLNQETIYAIADVDNAYYHANAWVLKDPDFEKYTPDRRYQRFSMAWMYYIWGGDDWHRNDHWLSYDVHECDWYMQNSSYSIDGWHENNPDDPTPEPVCDEDGKLRVLNLTNNNLQGFMPASQTVNFPEMVIIDVANNNISGFIPSVGEDTHKLAVFSVAHNNFEGQLTGGGGFHTFGLRVIRLEGNGLYGYLAGIYWLLPDIQVLDSTGNRFEGVIEASASMCKNLTRWRIGENLYEGTIPSEIGKMVALEELVVGGNEKLTGTIPSELGLLSNLNLLDISATELEGEIPEGLCSRVEEGALKVLANCSSIKCCE